MTLFHNAYESICDLAKKKTQTTIKKEYLNII